MKEETISVEMADPEKCKCFKCIHGFLKPDYIGCGKFRVKPREVLYENAECSEFKALK